MKCIILFYTILFQRKKDFQEMRQARQALRDELNKPGSDMAVVKKLAGELKNLQARQVDARVEGILDMKKVLTPEQFKAFQEKTKQVNFR
jgi:Spy/CpxP family protein refolding chaperone